MDYRTYHCPHCGKELQVPGDSRHIVCMFCAKPIDLPETENGQAGELSVEIKNVLPGDVFSFRIELNQMTKNTYPDIFDRYSKLLEPALRYFRQAALTNREEAVRVFTDVLMDGFERQIANEKSSAKHFDCRFTIVSLMIPCLLEQEDDAARQLADNFLEKWNARFPKRVLGKATYEQITGGFRKKLCFITTAVCGSLQKGDSCPELAAFRAFRDSWLKNTPAGRAKITEYYLFAPMIVSSIERSQQKEDVYRDLWGRYLSPCLHLLRAGDNPGCCRLYETMMRDLEEKWLS